MEQKEKRQKPGGKLDVASGLLTAGLEVSLVFSASWLIFVPFLNAVGLQYFWLSVTLSFMNCSHSTMSGVFMSSQSHVLEF